MTPLQTLREKWEQWQRGFSDGDTFTVTGIDPEVNAAIPALLAIAEAAQRLAEPRPEPVSLGNGSLLNNLRDALARLEGERN